MTKPNATSPDPNRHASAADWGTGEDLLLAFAVNRHGNSDWDSVASELRKRTALPLTSHNCRSKYVDLKRRFAASNDYSDDKSDAPLLEELRRLRVAELRREVQRYDLNIESLELKVKRMEEERDRSLGKEESESDLEKKREGATRAEPVSEPATADEPVTGEELEKDQISVNESNSTDPEAEKSRTGTKEPEPAQTGGDDVRQDRTGQATEEPADLKSEPDRKPIPEDSCNGSSNSIDKSVRKAKNKPKNDSTELVEPKTESGGGGDAGEKENSDVQSSVSRSRKEEGNDKMHRASTSGDEREHEDQSRAVKNLSAESQPLVDFLQSIRSQKFGSVFQRRLRSQNTWRYRKLVLQHMDLDTIETRLKEGWYLGSSSKFFRDLLLLVNNALVFFAKKSAEANAATEIRCLVSKEISQRHSKSRSSSRKQVSLQSLSITKKQKSEPLLKPRISGSLIVCRKRSSIASKAPAADKKKEQVSLLSKEKDDSKQNSQQSGSSAHDPKITKKRTGERFPSASGNSKKNVKNQPKKNMETLGKQQQGKGGSTSSHNAEAKKEMKKNQLTTLESKKRGAANLLNRMKQGSPSNNGALVDALKNRPLTSESTSVKGGGGATEVKNGKRGGDAASKKNVKEKSSPGKRNVGRPPKRGAAPVVGKRVREKEKSETETGQGKKRARKIY